MNKLIVFRDKKYEEIKIQVMVDKIFDDFVNKSIKNHNMILIKPNLMYYWDSSTGETTDPLVVSCIIKKLIELCGSDVNIKIIESDASAMRTRHAFRILGYEDLISTNVELFNLSKGETIFKEVKINNRNIKIKINKILMDKNYLINIPKIKVHRNPPILTCALKNNFGLISTPYKFQYHKNLSDYILAVNRVIKNDLVIVDGLTVLGKHPKKMGIMMATEDPVICDVVSSKICGINPYKDYITSKFITQENKFEKIDLIDPNNVFDSICKDFPRVNPHKEKMIWDALLYLLDLYSQIVGDIKPPVLE